MYYVASHLEGYQHEALYFSLMKMPLFRMPVTCHLSAQNVQRTMLPRSDEGISKHS